ncbi:MAG: hypothetical protein JNM93_13820 [Bacteriovoracaceae bacterium]|nr:hypothetical protein [Bacteriovoracaceae bacterium]
MLKILSLAVVLGLVGCGSFKAKRVGAEESDERGLEITDNWMAKDTSLAIEDVLKKMQEHRGFQNWLKSHKGSPTLFVAEVQNQTSEAYFPIDDMNDEFLNELSSSGEFTLVDAAARDSLLKEITYQNDGMVDPKTAKTVGKQVGADLMIFGNVYMKPEKRDGKTIKEYSVNLRMTDIEKGIEVFRVRTKIYKYSDQKGWSI